MLVYACNLNNQEDHSKFEASVVSIVGSRPARATQQDPVSKIKKKREEKEEAYNSLPWTDVPVLPWAAIWTGDLASRMDEQSCAFPRPSKLHLVFVLSFYMAYFSHVTGDL